mgnify:CR=1 FL=1
MLSAFFENLSKFIHLFEHRNKAFILFFFLFIVVYYYLANACICHPLINVDFPSVIIPYTFLSPTSTKTNPYSTFSRAFRNCVDYYSHKAGSNNDDVVLVNFERPYVELGGIFLKKVGIRPFMYDKYINTDFSKRK